MIHRKKICIISYSHIARDARVLRQIDYLSPFYDLCVIGYGSSPEVYLQEEHLHWLQVPRQGRSLSRKLGDLIRIVRYACGLVDRPWVLRAAQACRCDAYLANNWDALPVAALAAEAHHAKLVLDIHESLHTGSGWLYHWLNCLVVRRYAARVDACTTVVSAIAQDYQRAFGLSPLVLRNIPSLPQTPATLKKTDPQMIRLVHHGVAARARRTDLMIRALAFCDPRYQLHLILTNLNSRYVKKLRRLAHKLAPGRVFFYPPLPAMQIVAGLSSYDVGFYPLVPTSYNNLIALPNKLFEFIAAGLSVCIGPSPSMAEVVRQHGCGLVAPSFQPQDLADLLNRTVPAQWDQMKHASITAARQLNADHEMQKLLDIFSELHL